jgi:uncharacterized protein (TIGR02266 family)
MTDTRKDKRAPVSLKVRFKSATLDEFIEQYSNDISRGGMFVRSKQPMPVGTLLKFEIQLKDERPLIHGVGRVVWKRESSEASDTLPAGMGIKFIRMDPECRALVDKIVAERGEIPGAFEAGGGEAEEPVKKAAPAPFFPTSGPTEAELPRPEDRTQVRHASEFLALALASAGAEEAAREAERKAEEARKRAEELERKRAAQQANEAEAVARTAAEAREEAEKDDIEQNKAEAAAREKAEPEKEETATTSRLEEAVSPSRAKSDHPAADDATRDGAKKAGDGAVRPQREETEVAETGEAAKAQPEPTARARGAGSPEAALEREDKRAEKLEPKPVGAVPATQGRGVPGWAMPAGIAAVVVLAIAFAVATRQGTNEIEPPTDTTTPAGTARGDEESNPAEEAVEDPGRGVAEGRFAEGMGAGREGVQAGGGSAEEEISTIGEGLEPVGSVEAPAGTAESAGNDETVAAGAREAVDEAAPPTPAPTAHLRIETTPPGALVFVNDEERGTAPLEVDVPAGEATTVTARATGYREATQRITPTAGPPRTVRLALTSLPYVLVVSTSPGGVRLRVGNRVVTTATEAPVRIPLPRPNGPLTVVGTRIGYLDATETVPESAFREENGAMVAQLSLALTPRPTPDSTGAGEERGRPGGAATTQPLIGGTERASAEGASTASATTAGSSGTPASAGSGSGSAASDGAGSGQRAADGDAPGSGEASATARGRAAGDTEAATSTGRTGEGRRRGPGAGSGEGSAGGTGSAEGSGSSGAAGAPPDNPF